MRIISGKAKGTKLYTLEGNNTRPTLDRVKESIFNIIQNEIEEAKVLDLFSGSGAIGLEFLSRGAKEAVICDKSKDAIEIIKKNIEKTQTKTEKIFLYFLSSIFCFNMTDCIPCFLLYKEFKSGPLFERDLLQNHSNSRLFGYSVLSKLVISSCRMHEPKL